MKFHSDILVSCSNFNNLIFIKHQVRKYSNILNVFDFLGYWVSESAENKGV